MAWESSRGVALVASYAWSVKGDGRRMNVEQFQRELDKQRVVRREDYVGKQWVPRWSEGEMGARTVVVGGADGAGAADKRKASSSAGGAAKRTAAGTGAGTGTGAGAGAADHPVAAFWAKLETYLKEKGMSAQDADKLIAKAQELHRGSKST